MNVDSILYNNIVVDICIGDSALIQGTYQLSSGIFSDTLTTSSGCDSIVTTSLFVHDTSFTTNTFTLCFGDSVLSGANYKFITGVYYDTLSSVFGCDSVVVTDLTVLDSVPILTDTLEICAGDSAYIGGSYFDTAGTYFETFTTTQGCDSVVEISLADYSDYFRYHFNYYLLRR